MLGISPVIAKEISLGHRENCLRLVKRRIDTYATTIVVIDESG